MESRSPCGLHGHRDSASGGFATKRLRRRGNGKDQARQWQSRLDETEWTAEDVRAILFNPIYGYGINLMPYETVVAHVQRLHRDLAQEQVERGRRFSLEELDKRFQELFTSLVDEGVCRRGPDAPTTVSKEEWLQAQQAAIERLAAGEEP